MCERGQSCPIVASIHHGCEKPYDRKTCLAEHCYWNGHQCREPLLRVELGEYVLGIDTASAFTVLSADTCQVDGLLGPVARQHCASLLPAACRQAVSCRWAQDRCLPDRQHLRYVSGSVPVIPWPAAPATDLLLHQDVVPYCSDHLFPQNEDGLIGMQLPLHSPDHALMHHIVAEDPADRPVVMDKARNTFCVGEHCLIRNHDVESRPKLQPGRPLVQHDATHRLLLDTGTTKTTVWPDMCQIGHLDLEYLEVRAKQVRYKLAAGTLARCRKKKC